MNDNYDRTVVVGLGNPILSDDGIGIHVVNRAERLLEGSVAGVDFTLNHSGGIDLLDELEGYKRAIIVDCIITGKVDPGTCVICDIRNEKRISTDRLTISHGLSLPDIIEAGRMCGYSMPESVMVLGVEAADITTFSEEPTAQVASSIDEAVAVLKECINNCETG